MKNYHLILVSFCLLLSSCAQPIVYTGPKLTKTTTVDVFYSVSEVKKHYTVMGRLISHKYADDIVKHELIKFAKTIGADAIVIIGVDKTITGKPNRVVADALKYE